MNSTIAAFFECEYVGMHKIPGKEFPLPLAIHTFFYIFFPITALCAGIYVGEVKAGSNPAAHFELTNCTRDRDTGIHPLISEELNCSCKASQVPRGVGSGA